MDTVQLAAIQKELAKAIIIPTGIDGYLPKNGDIIFTLDIQYKGEQGNVALDVQEWGKEKPMGMFVKTWPAKVPYVPSFFCFREGPLLFNQIKETIANTGLQPNLIIVDGHGLAHPRKFGIACWLGSQLKIPAIGVAKNMLLPFTGELAENRGATLPILWKEEIVGYVLRTQKGVKPVYVSAGHLISHLVAVEIILTLSPKYRLCEPIRRADQAARRLTIRRDKS